MVSTGSPEEAAEVALTWDADPLKAAARPGDDAPAPGTQDARQEALSQAWAEAYAFVKKLTDIRQEEIPVWNANTDRLLQALSTGADPDPAGTASDLLARLKTKHFPEMFAFIASPKRRSKCAETAHAIAALVSRVCPWPRKLQTPACSTDGCAGTTSREPKGCARWRNISAPAAKEKTTRKTCSTSCCSWRSSSTRSTTTRA